MGHGELVQLGRRSVAWNRFKPQSIAGATFSIRPTLTVKAAAKTCWAKSCARIAQKRLYAATKIPPKNRQWPARADSTLKESYPPDHVEEYVHRSLKNADLQSFDLIQFHTWNDEWLRDDRWFYKLDDLRSQKLINAIGISINRWEPWNGIRAVRTGQIDAVQVIYNIFDQNPEDELFPACER